MHRSLRHLAHALALVSSVAATQPVAAAPRKLALDPAKLGSVSKALMQPVPMRVRVEIGVDDPTFEQHYLGAGSNTEDEIYYALAWQSPGQAVHGKIVRRSGDPDIWEMGPNSQRTVTRWIFAGDVAPTSKTQLAILLLEQEPNDYGREWQGNDLAAFDDDLADALLGAIFPEEDDHERVLGAQITLSGGAMKVVPAKDATVVESTAKFAEVRVVDDAKNYVLRIFLEPDRGPTPAGRRYLGNEDDDCSESVLKVVGSNGNVTIGKGKTKTVPIGNKKFYWFCGGSDEHSIARPGTETIDVMRASGDDDTITWKCFDEIALGPDIAG